jgi:hypothetical protein
MIARFIATWFCVCVIGCAEASPAVITSALDSSRQTIIQSQQALWNDREVAARFAPLFYQALGDKPRGDYFTNFDFDGDWRGDNNWSHTDDRKYPLKAYVYYSVLETASHFFIHYAVFHPRDYKGGRKGTILSELIREGAKRGGMFDPTGLGGEAALAHENDMEGCLIVVLKDGKDLERARVAFVETLHHNNFSRYFAGELTRTGFERIRLQNQHPLLYIEPKGHGIESFTESDKQVGKKDFLFYRFSGQADDPGSASESLFVCRDPANVPCPVSVNYDLLPIRTTLWARAKNAPNITYGRACDYGRISIMVQQSGGRAEKKIDIGKVGCAFLGRVGGRDMARPPWAWFDKDERDRTPGQWFFDPAGAIKRNFDLDDQFSTAYLRLPFWAG